MASDNCYDVTSWRVGDPYEDVGEVINSMIADVRTRQTASDVSDGGKPGAVIYVPPGDYRLRTQVRIDVSHLRIEGSGHGFTSSSIRFNVPEDEWSDLHELWPGGSRVLVDIPRDDGGDESDCGGWPEDRAKVVHRSFESVCATVGLGGYDVGEESVAGGDPDPTRSPSTGTEDGDLPGSGDRCNGGRQDSGRGVAAHGDHP